VKHAKVEPQKTPRRASHPPSVAGAVLAALAMLALGACLAAPGTAETPPPPPPPSAATPVDFKAITAKALSTVAHPAAAIVLSVHERQVLGVAEVNGGDAANTALRPGSTMKPLLAYAAIDRGVTLDKFACEGTYHDLTCHGRHGELDLERAIAISCNAYFYDVAHTLGLEQSMAALRSFGLGAPTTLMPHETAGHVPAFTGREQDLEARYISTATGHGQLRVSLLQLAAAYVTLATKLTEAAAGTDARSQALARITTGMRTSVEKGGKAHRAAVPGLAIAGKTGAGEPVTESGPPPSSAPMNGWFVAYAPISAPEIVVAVVVAADVTPAGVGPGSEYAAPIAGEILRSWFTRSARPASSRGTP
jgi:cell division protein FtsI/penicillin-binding protein 2